MKTIAKIGFAIIGCMVLQEVGLQGCCIPRVETQLRAERKALTQFLVALGKQPAVIAHVIFEYAPELLCRARLCTLEQTPWRAVAPLCSFSRSNSKVHMATFNGACVQHSVSDDRYRSSYFCSYSAATGSVITPPTFFYEKSYRYPISSDVHRMGVIWTLQGGQQSIEIQYMPSQGLPEEPKAYPLKEEEYKKANELQRAEEPALQATANPFLVVCSDDNTRLIVSCDSVATKTEFQVWELNREDVVYAACARLAREDALRKARKLCRCQ